VATGANMKCMIFGAGATAYCDIANPERRPPLVRTADFLRIVEKPLSFTLASSDFAERFLNPFCVWAFKRFDNLEYLFTLLFMISLEDSFEEIQTKLRGKYGGESWLDDAVLVAEKLRFAILPRNVIVNLVGLVRDEIQLCLGTAGPHPSPYKFQSLSSQHRKIVGTLKPGDAVISFNWDTVVDYALLNEKLLNEASFKNLFLSTISMPDDYKIEGTPVSLLKPHGSFNWYSTIPTGLMPERIGVFFGKLYEGTEFTIMPPVILPYLFKEPILERLPVFKNEMESAYKVLGDCDELVVIGKQFLAGDKDLAGRIQQACALKQRRTFYVNPTVKNVEWVRYHDEIFNAANIDESNRLFSDMESYIHSVSSQQ
jgi:hypothetical protein